MKKLKLALGAFLGLTALAVPAAAPAQTVDFSIGVSNRPHHNPYYREYNRNRNFRGYYNSQRHYRYLPRCERWEVAVRNPYRPRRYVCIDRDVYNDWRRSDAWRYR